MLEKTFLQILNMSFTASFVIIFVLLARLLLKRSPKILSCALWGVVLFRLVCPLSFESVFSFLPVKANPISQDIVYQATPTVEAAISLSNHTVNQLLPTATPAASVNPLQIWIFIGAGIWLLGVAILLAYSLVSLLKLKKRLQNAAHEKDNIYLTECMDTPFVMGIIKPKIYLPTNLVGREKTYILLHEQMHIRRLDHIVKIISFFALCLHWFNPLVWLAFFVSGKDMEMACDEAVIKQLGSDVKKEYSSSLLALATGKHIFSGSPLAFGEGDTRDRIKNVLNYKKSTFWVVAAALIATVIIAFGLLANPMSGIRLLDADDMNFSVETLDKVVYGAVIADNQSVTLSRAEAQEVADFIKNLRIDKKAVSQNRGADRGSINQVHLAYEGFSNNGTIYNLYFNFDTGFTEVWLDNETKPSLSYRLKKPDEVKAFFDKQLGGTAKPPAILSVNQLWEARTKYVGDNSAVGRLIGFLPVPEGVEYDHFELHTSGQPYGIEIVYSVPTDELREYDTEDSPMVDIFRKNALLLLALVENVEDIRAVLTDGEREVGFNNGRAWADHTVGGDIRAYSDSPEKLQELVDLISPVADPLEDAIHKAIIEYNKNDYRPTDIFLESHVVLATEASGRAGSPDSSDIETITVYAMVLYEKYNFIDDESGDTEMVSAAHGPVAITFDRGTKGEYLLREYWYPRDGSYYKPDIESKFPEAIWRDALDTQKYIDEQKQNIKRQLIERGVTP